MPHIRQTYDNLSHLQGELEELRRLILQEREDIVSLNLIGLNERRARIDQFFARVREFSDRTAVQIASACAASGITGDPSLSQLISAIPKPDRELFARLQKSVQALSQGIENDLAINRALLRDSLAFTNQSLQMFTNILKSCSSTTYGQQGRFKETIDQPRIICKEI